MRAYTGTHMKNEDLKWIYKFLRGEISQMDLSKKVGRTRTNTYYYIGRAVHYWVQNGVIDLKDVKRSRQLGGDDVRSKKNG